MTRASSLSSPAAPEPASVPACRTQPMSPLASEASPTWHGRAALPDDPLRGTPYRFVRALGARSEMGELVEAEHTGLGRRVVVKLLGAKLSGSGDYADRMRLEAQALAAISHPHVVTVLDVGKTPAGRTYLVMEKLVGRTLGEELAARGFLPVAEAVTWVRQLLDGLDAVHLAGLVHRDVKPANVFLCDGARGGRVLKLIDFGIAKVVHHDADRSGPQPLAQPTAPLIMVGTPRWMAPEQILAQRVGPWTDIYAAGAVLYAVVTGRDPFSHRRESMSLLCAHVEEMPHRPSAGAPQAIPEGVEQAIMKALEKRPERRWASAAAFSEALAYALTERTVGGGTAIQPSPHARAAAADPTSIEVDRRVPRFGMSRLPRWRWPGRATWGAALAAFALAVVVGTILGRTFLVRRHHASRRILSSAAPLVPYTEAPPPPPSSAPAAAAAPSAPPVDGASAAPDTSASASTEPAPASARPPAAASVPRRVHEPVKVRAVSTGTGAVPMAPPPAPSASTAPTPAPSSHRMFGVEE